MTVAAPVFVAARIDGAMLGELLRRPLLALRIPVPSIEECAELSMWLTTPRRVPFARSNQLSNKPHERMVAFLNAFEEVEQRSARLRDFVANHAPIEVREAALEAHDQRQTFKLAAVRKAIADVDRLISPPRPHKDNWHDAAGTAALVFSWIIHRNDSAAKITIAPGGPLVRFVGSVISYLGWSETDHAIVQELRRSLGRGEWRNSS